jgi:hypothetical protein
VAGSHGEANTLFAYTEIWIMIMLMLKCCKRKTLLYGRKVAQPMLVYLSELLVACTDVSQERVVPSVVPCEFSTSLCANLKSRVELPFVIFSLETST